MVNSISATGTLEPEEVVDVGAQVAGQVMSFGKDSNGQPVDWRSPVEPNMVLAQIDDTVYKADKDVAEAELAQAITSIQKGEADLAQATSKLTQAQHNWDRARTLGPSDALSQNDYDMYQADYESAKASVAIAQSEIAQAKNGVPLAQAELDKAKRNLDFCTISFARERCHPRSSREYWPDRRLEPEHTKLVFDRSGFIENADLGQRKRSRCFTGCARCARHFHMRCVPRSRLPRQGGQGAMERFYESERGALHRRIDVQNPDQILIPYATAKVQFEVGHATNSLIIPNMALRWVPQTELPDFTRCALSMEKKSTPPAETPADEKHHTGTVWVRDGDFVRPVDVQLGVTDRTDTAIECTGIKEGDQVVTGDVQIGGDTTTKNPFMPPMQKRGR